MSRDMFYGATPQIFEQARQLRETMTPAETVLWEALKMNRLCGARYKAQHPISNCIADFYNHSGRLVIEVDGDIHNSAEQREYDDNRTSMLNELGIRVLRFRNEEVMNSIDSVLTEIARYLPEKG